MEMMKYLKRLVQSGLNSFGYELVRHKSHREFVFPLEACPEDLDLLRYVIDNHLSMVSPEGLWSTLSAVKYVCENEIPGDFVECGVWRGGNAIIAAEIFRRYESQKKVYLFDTFSGMSEPTSEDRGLADSQPAMAQYLESDKGTHNEWCYAPIGEVRRHFTDKNLLTRNVVFVEGDVEMTLQNSKNLPSQIALLRLDTDWYGSTKLELEVLFPKVSVGGCLIVDDYGFWSGSKKATDEYFSNQKVTPLFHVTDGSRRIAIRV